MMRKLNNNQRDFNDESTNKLNNGHVIRFVDFNQPSQPSINENKLINLIKK